MPKAELAKPGVYDSPDKLSKAQLDFEKVDSLLKDANEKWEGLVNQLDDLS